MKEILKNILILCIITCVSGALLGAVYDITKEPRAQAEIKAKENAYKKVLKEAETFETLKYFEEDLTKFLAKNSISKTITVNEMVAGEDEYGNLIGYAITVTSKEGYGGDIKFTVGITNDGTVKGLSILSISETAGLGMEANKPSFLNQFKDKNVPSFVVTTTGSASDAEIDAISGATITTKAMVNATNCSICVLDFIKKETLVSSGLGGASNGK